MDRRNVQSKRLFLFIIPWMILTGHPAGGTGAPPVETQTQTAFWVPPCTAPARLALACETGGWAKRLDQLAWPGTRVEVVPVPGLPGNPRELPAWTTDQWVFCYRGKTLCVLQFPAERGLYHWGINFCRARGWECLGIGEERDFPEKRFDAGGNILVSPPIPPRYPRGLLITSRQLQRPIKDFFKAQQAQTRRDGELVELDTSWLEVGHVDELVSFVPDRKNGGFRLVLPDPEAGLKLLGKVPPDQALFSGPQLGGKVSAAGPQFLEDRTRDFSKGRWQYLRLISGKGAGQVARVAEMEGSRLQVDCVWDLQGPSPALAIRARREENGDSSPFWITVPDQTSRFIVVESCRMWLDLGDEELPAVVTAGELAQDPGLLAATKMVNRRLYGPGGIQEVLCRALELDPKKTLRLPVLFWTLESGRGAGALIPNPVNLVCVDREVICLAPLGPLRDPADRQSDVFRQAWQAAFLELGLHPHFLDGWDPLHHQDGGARCGTNVLRKPQ